MRTFHIFNINPHLKNLLKDDYYPLYHSLSKIKDLKKDELSIGINIYEQVAMPFNKDKLSNALLKYYGECDFYSKFQNKHSYINKYRNEESYLRVGNAYIKLESNVSNPDFFKYLKSKHNLFVCDFENADYFLTDEL